MNPCQRVDSLLSFFINDECSPAENRFVEGHLVACARCRRERRDLEAMMARVRDLPRCRVSEGFTDRVLEEAIGRPRAGLDEPLVVVPPSLLRRWGPPLATAAALGLVAFLGLGRLGVDDRPSTGPVASNRAPGFVVPSDPVESSTHARPAAIGTVVPEVHSLAEIDPSLAIPGDEQPTSLGTRYVLDDWVLKHPTGGGDPVLTRVAGGPENKAVVTF